MEADRKHLAPKEGRWIGRPRKPQSLLRSATLSLALVQIPNLLRMIVKDIYGHFTSWVVFGGVVLAMAGWLFFRVRRTLRTTAVERSLLDGTMGDEFLVEVTLVVENQSIAADRGVLWFADGLMGFSGAATSFLLASSDIDPKAHGQDHPRSGETYPPDSIVLRNAPREAYIVVQPLGGTAIAFQARLREFLLNPPCESAERVWPPLGAYDEVRPQLEAVT